MENPGGSIGSNEGDQNMNFGDKLLRMVLKLRARARRDARGVTLLEVLIVVAIIAMVAGGVAFYALPRFRESQVKTAETGARVIRQAVQSWQASNNETSCPTISQLVQDKQLDPGANTNDPWNQPYVINCTDGDVTVSSSGPDKKKGTKDDVRVPKTSAPSEGAQNE
jgi:general secretion pathway protein G